jgi:hydroxymethylpyrimidine/phosphomethylpyrimidine kinase
MKRALSIAGSDPSGGAGIQADIKTFAALGVYGMAVPAALTAQNTMGVEAVRAVSPAFLKMQLYTLLSDVKVDAAKTGMLLDVRTIETVSDALKKYRVKNLVLDPVMVSSSGSRLLAKRAVEVLVARLFPLAELVTPNIDEASVLAGMKIETEEDVYLAARRIRGLGPRNVLIKGGHLKGAPVDFLFDGKDIIRYPGKRVEGKKLHGAGCVYSAAIAAGLAKGMGVKDSIAAAKKFVSKAIRDAAPVGKGRVPLI